MNKKAYEVKYKKKKKKKSKAVSKERKTIQKRKQQVTTYCGGVILCGTRRCRELASSEVVRIEYVMILILNIFLSLH